MKVSTIALSSCSPHDLAAVQRLVDAVIAAEGPFNRTIEEQKDFPCHRGLMISRSGEWIPLTAEHCARCTRERELFAALKAICE